MSDPKAGPTLTLAEARSQALRVFDEAEASRAREREEERMQTRLERFARLDRGWNGYDAPPPGTVAVATATEFLRILAESGCKPRRLTPSAMGGVGITLRADKGQRRVYVEIRNDGTVLALFTDGETEPDVMRIPPNEAGFRVLVVAAGAYLS